MTVWLSPRREVFAQATARGASPKRAHEDAGLRGSGNASRVARDKKVVDRVVEITTSLAGGGSRDVGPIIDDLVAAAKKAINLNSASGFVAARALLAEAARQKMRLAADPSPFERRLAKAEWEKKWRDEA